jgi:hypothetical protein
LDAKIPTWKEYLRAYQREGIKTIPNHSSPTNAKSLGYKDWQNPNREYPFENLLSEVQSTNKCSALLGVNRVVVADIDLVKCLCSNTLHVKNSDHGVECVALARKWRIDHLNNLRQLSTEVSFTPHGGLHCWFKSDDKAAVVKAMSPVLSLDSRIFIEEVKAKGRQVLLPPSKIPDGTYVLMDNKGPRYLAENFKIRELN